MSKGQIDLREPVTREHWEPVWPCVVNIHLHPARRDSGVADYLLEPWPEGVRLDTGRPCILRRVHGCWVSRLTLRPSSMLIQIAFALVSSTLW